MPRSDDASSRYGLPPEAMTEAEAHEAILGLRRRLAAIEAAHPAAAARAAEETAAGGAAEAVLVDQAQLYALFMQAPAAITLTTGPEHTCVFINAACREAVGDREMVGKPLREALPDLKGPGLLDRLDEVYRTGEAWSGQEVRVHLNGAGPQEERYYNILCRPWCGAGGAPEGVITFGFEVTELVRARQKVEASLHVSRTGTYCLYPRSRMIDADAELRSLYELPGDAAMHSAATFLERIHPEDRARVASTIRRRLTEQDDRDLEYRIVRSDGTVRWMWDKARTVPAATGVPHHLIGACTDITERKQVEEALHASETRLRAVLDALPVTVAIADAEGRLQQFNPAVRELWGAAPLLQAVDEYAVYRMWDVHTGVPILPEDRPLSIALRTGRTAPPVEAEIETFDGERKIILNSGVPILDETGHVTGGISVSVDITSRKRAEEALRQSEERFRSLVEATTAIVWTATASGAIGEETPGWAAFTGQSQDEAQGEGWLDAVHPDDRERTVRLWQTALQQQAPFEIQHRLRRHDGVYRHMLVRGVPLIEGDDVREWIGTHTDITEVVEAEAELRRMNETLEERVAERTQALVAANAQLREAQEELALSYHRLRSIIDSTEDYIVAFDAEMRLTAFNAAYAFEVERTFGVRPTLGMQPDAYLEHLGERIRPLINLTHERWGQALTGETFTIEQSVPHPNGAPRYIESRYSPIRDETGAVVGGVALVRDITERYEAQQAVRRNETHFREALSGSQLVLARMDRERRYEWVHNPALRGDYGDLIGKRDDELFDPVEVQALVAFKEEVLQTGRPARRELALRLEDELRTYDITAAPLLDAEGNVIGLTTATLDVTEHREAQEALRRSEALYRTLITSMTEGLVLYGPDGSISASNPAAEAILGMEGDELRRRASASPAWRALNEDGGIYPAEEHPVAVVLRTKGPILGQTIGHRRPDGAIRWLSVNAQPLLRQANVEGVILTFRDITEAKGAEERLARTNRELEQRNRELQDFAYVASHDLQEPLRKIRAFADLMGKDVGEAIGEEGRLYLGRIQHAAARMSQLITDLLAFSRVQTRGEAFRQVDLDLVLREVLTDLEVAVGQSGGTVSADGLPTIEADPTQMRQLLQNLVGNALKFHRPGASPHVRVHARVERRSRPGGGVQEVCVLEVEDDGIGFETKYLDRIFAPFQRLHGRSAYEGTGMGLAICRRIVERHGGEITAHANAEEGVTFVATLPVKQ